MHYLSEKLLFSLMYSVAPKSHPLSSALRSFEKLDFEKNSAVDKKDTKSPCTQRVNTYMFANTLKQKFCHY